MWQLTNFVNNYEDGVFVGYGVAKGSQFLASAAFTGGDVLISVPYLGSLTLLDMSTGAIPPFAPVAAVFIAFNGQNWMYRYYGDGGLACTINGNGSLTLSGDNGVISPLPPGSIGDGATMPSPFVAVRAAPADGTTVVGDTSLDQYVVYGGAKFWLPSRQIAATLHLDLGRTERISQSIVNKLAIIPIDGTLLREPNSARVYLVQDSHKSWLSSPSSVDAHGGSAAVRLVPEGSLDVIPNGPDVS